MNTHFLLFIVFKLLVFNVILCQRLLLVRVAAFFVFLLQKRYRPEGSMDCLIRCSVLFLICIPSARHVSPFEISCAKLAYGDSNCRMNLD